MADTVEDRLDRIEKALQIVISALGLHIPRLPRNQEIDLWNIVYQAQLAAQIVT